MAVLSYLDFFSTGVQVSHLENLLISAFFFFRIFLWISVIINYDKIIQRVALSTAANMCKKLPSDAADFVMEAVPLLTNLLQYHDAKVRKLYLSNTINLVTPEPILTPILHSKPLSFSLSHL